MKTIAASTPISTPRHWPAAAAALTALTLAAASTGASVLYHAGPIRTAEVATVFAAHVAYWLMWAAIGIGAYMAARVSAFGNWRAGAGAYALLATTAVAALALYYAGSDRLALFGAAETGRGHARWYAMSNAALFALVCLGAAFAYAYQLRQAKETERQEALLENQRLAAALADARLSALRGQIHPHLIFNALNCVAALVDAGRRDEANRAIAQLGELLRATLSALEKEHIALHDEFAVIERMFEIGRLRFGERFTWEIDLPAPLARLEAPPFLLQPLAENALVHAVGGTSAPVHVSVRALRLPDALRLEVEDRGGEPRPAPLKLGLGLRNLEERVKLLHGRLSLTPGEAGGIAARIDLPLRAGDAAHAS